MAFTRTVAAISSGQQELTPNVLQQVIYAYGNDGVTTMRYHSSNRGGTRLVLLQRDVEEEVDDPEESPSEEEIIEQPEQEFEEPEKAKQGNASLAIVLILIVLSTCGCIGIYCWCCGERTPKAYEINDIGFMVQEESGQEIERVMTEDDLPTVLRTRTPSGADLSCKPSAQDDDQSAAVRPQVTTKECPCEEADKREDVCNGVRKPRCTHRAHWRKHNIGATVLRNARQAALDAVDPRNADHIDHQVEHESFANTV